MNVSRGACCPAAGRNHDGNSLNARAQDFPDDDGERALGDALAVHESLQWQAALALARGGDDGFSEIHVCGESDAGRHAWSNSCLLCDRDR